MADISKIKIPTGTYNIKDATARSQLDKKISGYALTSGTTSAYTASISGITLTKGTTILLRFNATNAANATLNVNSLGAKPIYYKGKAITAGIAPANAIIALVYDNVQVSTGAWHCVYSYNSNTTYSNASLGQGYGTCSTEATTTAKVVTLSNYSLTTGGIISINFTNAVPASATLDINSKGAKPIYYKGKAITAGIIKAGDIVTFIYDGSHYNLISFDRDTTYTLPTASSTVTGGIKIGYGQTDKKYAVKLDGNDKAYVEVPWTDTKYSNMTGASSSVDGDTGLVPKPSVGDQSKYLKGDGTWGTPTNTTYKTMTGASSTKEGASGLVPKPASGEQSKFLKGDGTWAVPTDTKYTTMKGASSSVDGDTGLVPKPSAGDQSKFLRADGTWVVPTDTKYTNATISKAGLMSADDKTKLDNSNIAYGTCTTAGNVAEKVVTITNNSNWSLKVGSIIYIRFSYTNTAENPTLNIDNIGPKSIYYDNANITTDNLQYAGYTKRTIIYLYNGTQFVFIGWSIDSNTWVPFKGATTTDDGIAGYIPAPSSGQTGLYFRSDGKWGTPTDTKFTLKSASTSALGGIKVGYTQTDKKYAVSLDSNDKAYVEVPWTDTKYSNMTGASSSTAGTAGLVPKPTAGSQSKYLKGDGTWDTPTNTTYNNMKGASSTENGTAGLVPAPTAGNESKFLRANGKWETPTNTTYDNATNEKAGLMSADDKTKLDGIASGAKTGTVKSITAGIGLSGGPITTSGTIKTNLKSETPLTNDATTPTNTTNRTYAVATDKSGYLAVNVPWTDTTYTNATTSKAGLMSNTDKTKLDNSNIAYGICKTESNTAEKVVTITGNSNWKLTTGAIICIRFSYTNTATNPTLNVENNGGKEIYYDAAVIATDNLQYAGYTKRTIMYLYNGTQFVFLGWCNDNNTWTAFKGATSTDNGVAGYVPAPNSGQTGLYFRSDGSWATPTDTKFTLKSASSSALGGIKVGYTDKEKTYKVQLDSNSNAYVEVPWTDTKYTNMTGASSSTSGKAGLVPTPTAGSQSKYLKGDGTWDTPTNTTYDNATTTKSGLMSNADKTKLDYSNIAYGTCTTETDTAEKVVNISGNKNWVLKAGSMISVRFSYTNTAINPTLNVNGSGPKAVYYDNAAITTDNLQYAGYTKRVINYIYNGTQFVFVGWSTDNNTTYSTMKAATADTSGSSGLVPTPTAGTQSKFLRGDGKWATPTDTTYTNATSEKAGLMSTTDKEKLDNSNIAYGTCTTAADVAEKVVNISGNTNWSLKAGSMISVRFSYTNTAENPTLNVNGTGAKNILYNGNNVITSSALTYAGFTKRVINYIYNGTQFVFIGWSTDNNTTYVAATATKSGLMSAADKEKFDKITIENGTFTPQASNTSWDANGECSGIYTRINNVVFFSCIINFSNINNEIKSTDYITGLPIPSKNKYNIININIRCISNSTSSETFNKVFYNNITNSKFSIGSYIATISIRANINGWYYIN